MAGYYVFALDVYPPIVCPHVRLHLVSVRYVKKLFTNFIILCICHRTNNALHRIIQYLLLFRQCGLKPQMPNFFYGISLVGYYTFSLVLWILLRCIIRSLPCNLSKYRSPASRGTERERERERESTKQLFLPI